MAHLYNTSYKRSHKPIVWGLFAAGGTVAAFVLPVVILLTGFEASLGLLPRDMLEYGTILSLLQHPLVRLIVFGVLMLITWHAAHRLRITAHDLGVRADLFVAILFYGIAAVATLVIALALVQLP